MYLKIYLFQNIKKLRNRILNNPWVKEKKSQRIAEKTLNPINIKIYIKIYGIQLKQTNKQKTEGKYSINYI